MLKQYSKNSFTFVIDELSGEVFATQNQAAKLCGIESTQLRRWLEKPEKGVTKTVVENSQVYTSGGLQGVTKLLNQKTLAEALFTFNLVQYKEFSELGMQLSLQRLVDYEQSSTSVMRDIDTVLLRLLDRDKDHRPAHNAFTNWCRAFGFQINGASKAVVKAVTGVDYYELMNGHEYGKEWSVDVVNAQHIDAITRLKWSLANSQRKKGETLEQTIVRVAKRDKLLLAA